MCERSLSRNRRASFYEPNFGRTATVLIDEGRVRHAASLMGGYRSQTAARMGRGNHVLCSFDTALSWRVVFWSCNLGRTASCDAGCRMSLPSHSTTIPGCRSPSTATGERPGAVASARSIHGGLSLRTRCGCLRTEWRRDPCFGYPLRGQRRDTRTGYRRG